MGLVEARTVLGPRGPLACAMERPVGKPVGGALLLHGFNSDHREMGGVARALANVGVLAVGFDQSGFGASAGPRGVSSWEHVQGDAAAVLREFPDVTTWAVVGHSLGAAYSLALARDADAGGHGQANAQEAGTPAAATATTGLRGRQRIGCVVAAHPVDRLWDELNPIERAGYHVLGRLALRRTAKGRAGGTIPFKVRYQHLFEDPSCAAHAKALGFLERRVALANYPFARTQSGARWAGDVRVPALVLASANDRVVSPVHTRRVFEAIAGPKTWLEHTGGHSCFLDRDGPRLSDAVAAFVRSHIEAAP